MHGTPHVTAEFVERVAALAVADRRTVERRLAGLPVRGGVARRIDDAIARLRADVPSRPEAAE